jgi:HSP20 family protein
MEQEIENVCGRFFRERPWLQLTGETSGVAPAMAMLDRKEEVVLRADLPGLEQRDIEVTVDHGVLNIRGERREQGEASEEAYGSRERWVGIFARSLTLPADVDVNKVSTTLGRCFGSPPAQDQGGEGEDDRNQGRVRSSDEQTA